MCYIFYYFSELNLGNMNVKRYLFFVEILNIEHIGSKPVRCDSLRVNCNNAKV